MNRACTAEGGARDHKARVSKGCAMEPARWRVRGTSGDGTGEGWRRARGASLHAHAHVPERDHQRGEPLAERRWGAGAWRGAWPT